MKLFGNSRRRTSAPNQKPEEERLIAEQEEYDAPAPKRQKKTPEKEAYNPRRALVVFGICVVIFVAVIVMCLTLIERSGESSFQPSENEIKDLEYVVGAEPGQPTESTQPLPELIAPAGVNESDILNILFLSPDSETQRTDSVMLLNIDLGSKDVSLLSLPRDTYISGNYDLPKLQTVYFDAEGGDRGAQALLEKTKEMIGFWPDYYFVLDQSALSMMVEMAGGSVEFEIPASVNYTDLNSGKQNITGASAMELFQYSDDFSKIETESTKIQRDFFMKLLRQFLKETKDIMATAQELSNVLDTNLTEMDLAYLVDFLKKAKLDSVYSTCLSGKEIQVDGESFFQVDIEKAVALLNEHFNPTEDELSVYDVNFRQKTGDSGEGNFSDFGFPTTPTTTKPVQGTMPAPTEPPSTEGNSEPSELPELPDEPNPEVPDSPSENAGDTP